MRPSWIAAVAVGVVFLSASTVPVVAQNSLEQASAHCAQLFSDPKFDPIREKVILLPGQIGVRQLSDKTLPTKPERDLILAFADRRDVCNRNTMETALVPDFPHLIPAVTNIWVRGKTMGRLEFSRRPAAPLVVCFRRFRSL